MVELSLNEIMRNREIARGMETYRKQDIVQREGEKEDFISERADIKMLVRRLHETYYSRYLENEKPTIDAVV